MVVTMILLFLCSTLIAQTVYGLELEIINECPVPFSINPTLSFNGKCDCSGDWLGSYCTVCSSDTSCETAFGGPLNDPSSMYQNHRCGKSYIVTQEQPTLRTWCDVNNEAIVAQTNGPSFAEFTYDALTLTARLEFLRYLEGAQYEWVKLFACSGTECSSSISEDGNTVQYSCVNVDCALTCEVDSTAECTNFFRVTVNTIGGQVSKRYFLQDILSLEVLY